MTVALFTGKQLSSIATFSKPVPSNVYSPISSLSTPTLYKFAAAASKLSVVGPNCETSYLYRETIPPDNGHNTARALIEARKVILRVQRCLGAGMV